jgi:N-acetyl sugar amidotransferase
MINYCIKCCLPATKPDLYIDKDGLCAACLNFDNRIEVNWDSRESEFKNLIKDIQETNENGWDCVVPVSGGKDSTAQVIKALEYGLRPLCVNATTCDLTEVGRKNLNNLKELGADLIELGPSLVTRRKLNRIALEIVGDISWPEHVSIFTFPVRVALNFKIPLILWGENPQNEFGGPIGTENTSNAHGKKWLDEFGGLLGLRVSDISEVSDISQSDLNLYTYPDDAPGLSNIRQVYQGYYFPWDGIQNYLISSSKGFQSYGKFVENSIVEFENIDNFQTGIHDYFKFLKYGYSRTTDIVSLHVRRSIRTRNEALDLIRERDGKFPWTYLGKSLKEIISPLGLDIEDFIKICDKFTNRNLFLIDANGELIKDRYGNLTKTNYDN